MAIKVKIYGAGSIGNHLSQASRRLGWEVTVVDKNPDALKRMKEEIYPKRYGAWDEAIKLVTLDKEPKGGFDVICIGTPPEVHFKIATKVLSEEAPRVLQIEKPLGAPLVGEGLKDYKAFLKARAKAKKTAILVGHEYVLAENVLKARDFIARPELGKAELLEVNFRENWSGIMSAHPWLAGPHDTYLGHWRKGGGASGEHSHAIHFWQFFADALGLGAIKEVGAMMDIVVDKKNKAEYDRITAMHVKTNKKFQGRIIQDVVTNPPRLTMRAQRENGFVEWERYGIPGKGPAVDLTFGTKNANGGFDVVKETMMLKRPDDFYHEVLHINDILTGKVNVKDSPMSVDTGLHALSVFSAAHDSYSKKNGAFVKV